MPSPDRISQVLATVDRCDGLPPRSTVLVAVSGGVDSMALLDLVVRIAARRELRVHVAHHDHGLRPGSVEDADRVERRSGEIGVPFHRGRTGGGAGVGSPEERAREERWAFLRSVAEDVAADRLATGHHADDRAEWALLRIAQGSAPASWAIPLRRGRVVRPLFDLHRVELEAYARWRGLLWSEDPTNRDVRVPRNRIRHRILPRLEAELSPAIRSSLNRVVGDLEADLAHLDDLGVELVTRAGGGDGLGAAALAEAPVPVARRAAARWLSGQGLEPRRAWVDALLELAAGRRRGGFDVVGARIVCEAGRLSLERPGPGGAVRAASA